MNGKTADSGIIEWDGQITLRARGRKKAAGNIYVFGGFLNFLRNCERNVPNVEKILLLVQLAATLALTGIIWLIQIVHYPLFGFVGEEKYRLFHIGHMNRISFVVAPLMIVEAISAIMLVFYPPHNTDLRIVWFGIGLVGAIWLSTFLLQVPLHEKLAQGFDSAAHFSLVMTNWIRTVAWSLRAALVLWLGWQALK